MNELDFKARWNSDKPVYCAWGKYVVDTISKGLVDRGKSLNVFLKTPVEPRLKNDQSLIDKAYYRPSKTYTDPYNEIEDKVGARFIVLLLDDIKEICSVIEESEIWDFDACKHFNIDKETDPLLFTYQSVHFILRPKKKLEINNITISKSIPCEIQIRTLLQHAHAELTHDAIYKAKRSIKPIVHRTVAKCMALIETTDEYFKEATHLLNHGPLEEHGILDRLDGIYYSEMNIVSHNQKSSVVIWDVYEKFIDEYLVDNIQTFLSDYPIIFNIIKNKYAKNSFYHQSTVLFVYWLLKKKTTRLIRDWPLSRSIIKPMAVDLGISINDN